MKKDKKFGYATVADAADIAGVSESTIYKAIRSGELPSLTMKVIPFEEVWHYVWRMNSQRNRKSK